MLAMMKQMYVEHDTITTNACLLKYKVIKLEQSENLSSDSK